jgi:hypothetical protein
MANYPFSEECSKGSRFHGAIIFIAAFLVRFCVVWYLLGLDWRYDTGDGYENAFLMEYIFKKNCYMPPGQYLFAGSINQFFAEPQYCLLRIATICLSALVSVNIFRIGRDTYGTTAGIIAGYASIVSLVFMFHSWTFYGTALATCLCSFFIYYFLRMFHSADKKTVVLAGVFLGLSILTRAEMLMLVPFALLWFLVAKGFRGKNLSSAFTMVLIAFAVVSCWTLRNYIVCDKFVLVSSNAPVNYFIGNNPLQKGGYFSPRAPHEEEKDYLLSGLTYNLKHPGWFVEFFKEKFKLYWSSRTWEHPRQLLESRFNHSALRLFNTSFDKSRLSAFMDNPQLTGFYALLIFVYGYLIGIFWLLVLSGFFYSHLFWKKSYFLIGVCFASALVFSLFFSGANRCFVPILPYLYLVMGLGVLFLYQLPRLTGREVKALIGKNVLVVLVLLAAYVCKGFFICHPLERRETFEELHTWNVLSKGDESVRVIILESQLSYPVKRSAFTDDAFSVWVGGKEIPPLKAAGQTASDEKYYFKKVTDLLCKNAFIVNLPRHMMRRLLSSSEVDLHKTAAGEIVKSLNGKITVRYSPAWQLRRWGEGALNTALHFLHR